MQAPSSCGMTTAELRVPVLINDPEPPIRAAPALPQPPPGKAPVQYPPTSFAVALGTPRQQEGAEVAGMPLEAPQAMQYPQVHAQQQAEEQGCAQPLDAEPGC